MDYGNHIYDDELNYYGTYLETTGLYEIIDIKEHNAKVRVNEHH